MLLDLRSLEQAVASPVSKPIRVGGWPTRTRLKAHPLPPSPMRHPPALPVAPYWPVPTYPPEPEDVMWLVLYAARAIDDNELAALLAAGLPMGGTK